MNSVFKRIYLLSICFFLFCGSIVAQKKKVQNLPYVDEKLIHFGFVLGIHTQMFGVTPSGVLDEDNVEWKGDVVTISPGFTVGIISDLRLNKYFNLRFVPALELGDRRLTYSGFKDGVKIGQYNTSVLSTTLMFPFLIKFRSVRINNYRPYVIAGGGLSVDLARKSDAPIMLKPLDGFVEVGVGCDIYLQYFKLSPELKFSLGFCDMLERDRPMIEDIDDLRYTNAISKLTSRLLILSFNFE